MISISMLRHVVVTTLGSLPGIAFQRKEIPELSDKPSDYDPRQRQTERDTLRQCDSSDLR